MTPPPGSRKIAYDSTHFKWTWRAVSEMVTKDAKLVSMDRSSGLALTSAGNPGLSWNLIFAQNRWLSSYLPLLAQVDFVANAAKADEQGRSSYAACAWPSTLPFCWSTVSALRTCLFVMSGNDNQAVKGIIKYGVDMYIQVSITSVFLCRRLSYKIRSAIGRNAGAFRLSFSFAEISRGGKAIGNKWKTG